MWWTIYRETNIVLGDLILSKKTQKIDDQKGVKVLAEALRDGGTLLDISCPICAYPLIKINEKIFCKICDNEVIIYKDESELPKEYRKALDPKKTQIDSPMVKTLNTKIETLRKKMDATDDPDEIIKLSEAIEKLLVTLQRLES
ncbi:MAG: hypothetical protein FK730_16835 [Asgard group archaeon]|nr:hypothetical protein [Asgard group archaeon]